MFVGIIISIGSIELIFIFIIYYITPKQNHIYCYEFDSKSNAAT